MSKREYRAFTDGFNIKWFNDMRLANHMEKY